MLWNMLKAQRSWQFIEQHVLSRPDAPCCFSKCSHLRRANQIYVLISKWSESFLRLRSCYNACIVLVTASLFTKALYKTKWMKPYLTNDRCCPFIVPQTSYSEIHITISTMNYPRLVFGFGIVAQISRSARGRINSALEKLTHFEGKMAHWRRSHQLAIL